MGYIYNYTGEGAGKTTNALGLCLRSLGHGHNVVVIQFMKWWKETGEFKFKHSHYTCTQFGREGWKGKDNLTEEDKNMAREGLLQATKVRLTDLLVLDELNLAVAWGLLSETEVLKALDKIQKVCPSMTIVITGRYAPKGLIDRSDFVNGIIDIKHPTEDITTEGIQY